jgi:hypothetical protein
MKVLHIVSSEEANVGNILNGGFEPVSVDISFGGFKSISKLHLVDSR